MNHLIKILILSNLMFLSCKTNQPDKSENCKVKEIKYLSTYIDSRMWEVAGGNSIIDLNTAQEMAGMKDEEIKSANFFVPMLIKEIKGYYSDSILDEDEKNLLIEFSKFFGRIWNNDNLVIKEGDSETEICKKASMIIEKYHQLSEDDSEFYKMIFTLDDGPFYGIDTDSELEKIKEISVEENKLIIRGNDSVKTLELANGIGELKWRKIIARSEDYKIQSLDFVDNPIRVNNGLGYKIALIGDGELIQLYLRRNGDFRLFFHSW